MIVEACDKCKTLNTITPLLALAEYRPNSGVDPLQHPKAGYGDLFSFSVTIAVLKNPNEGKKLCVKCLTPEVHELISKLAEKA